MQISPASSILGHVLSYKTVGPIFTHGPQCDILLEGTCDSREPNLYDHLLRPSAMAAKERRKGSHFHFESGSQFVSQFPIVVDTVRQRVSPVGQIGS